MYTDNFKVQMKKILLKLCTLESFYLNIENYLTHSLKANPPPHTHTHTHKQIGLSNFQMAYQELYMQ